MNVGGDPDDRQSDSFSEQGTDEEFVPPRGRRRVYEPGDEGSVLVTPPPAGSPTSTTQTFNEGIVAWIENVLEGIRTEDADAWFRQVQQRREQGASQKDQPSDRASKGIARQLQKVWQRIKEFQIYIERSLFSVAASVLFIGSSLPLFIFMLFVIVWPCFTILRQVDKRSASARLVTYYYPVIIFLVYGFMHPQAPLFIWINLGLIVILFCVLPLLVLLSVYLLFVLDRSSWGLFPLFLVLIYLAFYWVPPLRPNFWPTSILPFSDVGIARSFFLAVGLLIFGVFAKILRDPSKIAEDTESRTGGFIQRVQYALLRVIRLFLINAWDLFSETIGKLARTLSSLILRVLIPLMAFAVSIWLLVLFEQLFVIYQRDNQYGLLLWLELIVLFSVIFMFISYGFLFTFTWFRKEFHEAHSQLRNLRIVRQTVTRLTRWGHVMRAFPTSFPSPENREFVSQIYEERLVHFILFYPIVIGFLAAFRAEPYDLSDPLFVATLVNIVALVIFAMAPMIAKVIMRGGLLRKPGQKWFRLLNPLFTYTWLIILLVATAVSYIQNRVSLDEAIGSSYQSSFSLPVSANTAVPSPLPTVTLSPINSLFLNPTPLISLPTHTQSLVLTPAATTTGPTQLPDTATLTLVQVESSSPGAFLQPTLTFPSTITIAPSFTPTSRPTVTQTPTETAVATVNIASANLRSGPGINYQVAGVAERGDSFPVVAQAGSGEELWYLITQLDGQRAWIWSGAVDVSPGGLQIQIALTTPAPPP